MKLLLVDDDGFLRDMYSTKFLESGYDVDVADGSAAVLSKLQEGKQYDLIILDMVMPGTSGVELLTIIREQFPEQTKCCIFLSNQGQEEDIREATEAGAIGYIIKAESIPSEVVKKVEVILKKCKK
jgi:DNA-binding response OmpR family regulator